MTLTNRDIIEITEWRRKLHRQPEISNEEEKTAKEVVSFLADTAPDKVLTGLGGHGVAAVYDSGKAGPTVLFRSELDALPIEELSGVPHASQVPGKSHACGHDGHTAMLLASLGRQLGRERPASGRVVLMFQPAEETGNGAAGVVADPRYSEIAPDFAFSLHNLPGVPFGEVRLKPGVVNCASRGMRIVLEGKTAHSSMPETGISPMPAISELMPALPALGRATFADDDFSMVTVTHAEMGEAVFGIAPAHAQVWATLRTRRDERMADLCAAAEALAGARPQPASPRRAIRTCWSARSATRTRWSICNARSTKKASCTDRKPCRCAPRKISACSATVRSRRCFSSAPANGTLPCTIRTMIFPTI